VKVQHQMVEIHHADSRKVPREDRSVHVAVTSPPYWNLRDYGAEGQIGLEKVPDCRGWATGRRCGECYVCHLVDVARETRRLLRDDGTLWLNLGDSYSSHGAGGTGKHLEYMGEAIVARQKPMPPTGLKPKDLVGIPWRVAFALQADGWYLRATAPWVKRSPMPESVEDRPASAVEYWFLFSKSAEYFYDKYAVLKPFADARMGRDGSKQESERDGVRPRGDGFTKPNNIDPSANGGRNRRNADWWFESVGMLTDDDGMPLGFDFTNTGFGGKHFATYPPKMCEPCILASTSEKGCCPQCGAGWRRLVTKGRQPTRPGTNSKVNRASDDPESPYHDQRGIICGNRDPQRHVTTTATVGWRPSCECAAGVPLTPQPCVVYDPFNGAASTAIAALTLGRAYVGCDVNPEYIAMSQERLSAWKQKAMGPLFASSEVA